MDVLPNKYINKYIYL